jgi:two-component system invasion response regulator UvrY
MIRICIADDHNIVRKGMEQLLLKTPDIRVVGEAGTGEETLDFAAKHDFDLLLLDISLPDRNGIEVLKELKSRNPALKVLILSMHAEEQYAVRALKAGASGYIAKSTAIDELASAIRKVAQGRKYVSASLAEKLAFAMGSGAGASPHEKLSDREHQVMLLVCAGKSIKTIASTLALSPKTITTYKRRIQEKLGLSSTAELIRYALESKLIT